MNAPDQGGLAAVQRDKVNAERIQFCQVSRDRKPTVKDQFTGDLSRSGFPISDKIQNGIILGFFSDRRVRVT